MASGSFDKTICIWKISTGVRLKTLQDHKAKVFSVAFCPNGDYLESEYDDSRVGVEYLDRKTIQNPSMSEKRR